jgi:hypothetical protein
MDLGNNFDYIEFLKRADPNYMVEPISKGNVSSYLNCIFCSEKKIKGINLNNKKYLCENCLYEIQEVRYPEKYQKEFLYFKNSVEEINQKKELFINHRLENLTTQRVHYKNRILSNFVETKFLISAAVLNLALLVLYLRICIDHSHNSGNVMELFKLNFPTLCTLCFWATLILLITKSICKSNYDSQIYKAREHFLSQWELQHPYPSEPELRHFYDPKAILSERDLKILEVLDYWPKYPPYWRYIRQKVLERDMNTCQVTGCPSRTVVHVHHKTPLSKGGSHRIENLITLCEYHHGLMPGAGHDQIWSEVTNIFFSLVRGHYRQESYVQTHIRRKELITDKELETTMAKCQPICPSCQSTSLSIEGFNYKDFRLTCKQCKESWVFKRMLSEETLPALLLIFKPSFEKRTWQIDEDHFELDKAILPKKINKKNTQSQKESSQIIQRCPSCNALLKKREGKYGKFWGCSNFPNCRFTKNTSS